MKEHPAIAMTNMNTAESPINASLRPINYWWLWIGDTVLVTAGLLFFLAAQYGTYEFFGVALVMALLPVIPLLVLVGGAGSTIFALTKVWIEKHRLKKPTVLALLVGPAIVVTLLLATLGASRFASHRLNFICAGHAPASANRIQITGYSAFLRGEWLAVFHMDEKSFQTFVTDAELVPADDFEFQRMFDASSLKATRLGQNLPPLTNAPCFKRVFKEGEEHERGSIFAVFDPNTSTAVVVRSYHD